MRQWAKQTKKAWEWENTRGRSTPGRRTNKWEALRKQRVRNVPATVMKPVWKMEMSRNRGGRFTVKHIGHCKDVGFYWGRKSLGDFRQAWHDLIMFHRITLPEWSVRTNHQDQKQGEELEATAKSRQELLRREELMKVLREESQQDLLTDQIW